MAQRLVAVHQVVAVGVTDRWAVTDLKRRAAAGQLASVAYNDKNERLYTVPEPPAMIACARCGQLIPERVAQGQRQKYCGVTCRTGAYAARRRAAGWKQSRNRP